MGDEERKNAVKYIDENADSLIIPQGSTNLNELREKIKHVYIRRLSSDIPGMVNKSLDTRYYDLDDRQKEEYDRLWDEYVEAQEENGDNTNEEYRQLVEGTLVRQFLAREMVPNTIELANDYIEDGEKVIIACNFTSEINAFKEYYGKQAVVYDGKMTPKQKDKSEKEFKENPKIKVFIGQIESAGVGLTLTASHIMIFNSYSWLETSNRQMQDRIYRITQKEDALCIYQLFTDSISQDMFEKVLRKGLVMDETIKAEKDK
jgi:SNF2 family DNA or RNA helicase